MRSYVAFMIAALLIGSLRSACFWGGRSGPRPSQPRSWRRPER
jgi:hypothetical protein